VLFVLLLQSSQEIVSRKFHEERRKQQRQRQKQELRKDKQPK